MARAARIGVDIFVIGALFVPFALAVFSMRTELAMPTIGQGALLLPLLLLPVWALHQLRMFKTRPHEPTLFD
jgi:hypothetical protein